MQGTNSARIESGRCNENEGTEMITKGRRYGMIEQEYVHAAKL